MQYLLKNLKSAFAIAILFAVGGLATTPTSFAEDTATKENDKTEATEKKDAEGPFTLPEGDVSELLTFIKENKNWNPKMPTRPKAPDMKDPDDVKRYKKESMEYQAEFMKGRVAVLKARKVLVKAADKVLASKDLDEKDRVSTVTAKLTAMSFMNTMGDTETRKSYREFLDSLVNDADKKIASQAKVTLFSIKAQSLFDENSKESPDAIAKEGIEILTSAGDKVDSMLLTQVSNAARYMEMRGEYELAKNVYNEVIKAAESDSIKNGPGMTEERHKKVLQGHHKNLGRVSMVGKPAELKGKLVSGDEFDVTSYKGKVVLIDFWATWCGPCIAELPNVVDNYKKFHDKGFEIVAVSIDKIDDKEKLEKFVKDKEIPWVQIQSTEENAQGWEDPRIQQYFVNGIPATFLVDREGNIVHLNVRGKRLGKVLEEMLGPAEDKKDDEKKVSKN